MSEHGPDSFRDRLGIVSDEGKRKWIYPRKPSGFFTRLRTIASFGLIAFLLGAPLVRVGDHPLMLFNIIDRKFIIFGTAFGPHDFYLFVLGMITLIVFIILFTVVYGRLFCGWVCPQTVFMEMVFRRIDYWIEGDHRQQQELDASSWNVNKTAKKLGKYVLYFVISFLIGNTLLSWIIGIDEVRRIVTDPPSEHLAGLTAMLVFSGFFYWIFIWFREQACILVCPYGRLQGVLLDRNSIVIAYDHVRGEPRGRLRKGEERARGDCIDCGLCVDVCPTGIDIRNGTQLECVNCTACIDSCDEVMVKINRPTGLIRYDSAEGIARRTSRRWSGKVVSYTVLLVLLLTALTVLVATRSDVDITILRTPGMFYQEQPDGRVSNIYDVKVLNKTFAPSTITVALNGVSGDVRVLGDNLTAPSQGVVEGKLIVILDRHFLLALTTPLKFDLFGNGKQIGSLTSTFLGPGSEK
jgi:cytochrome c oxidase accessory protein FixG